MLSVRLITPGCLGRLSYVLYSRSGKTGYILRNMSSSAKILGFSGATSSGKSSICRWLESDLPQENINVKTVHMDHYYWNEGSPNHVLLPEFDNKVANWEDVRAVDWPTLEKDVATWREKVSHADKKSSNRRDVLLIEGIMIYNYRPLVPYFDKKYFFTLPKDECWRRRRNRIYEPPDPEGYFEKVVWPCYVKLKNELIADSDIVYLDGTRNQDELFEEVRSDILSLFNDS